MYTVHIYFSKSWHKGLKKNKNKNCVILTNNILIPKLSYSNYSNRNRDLGKKGLIHL